VDTCQQQGALRKVADLTSCTLVECRLLREYQARTEAEGEYDEEELPSEVVESVESALGPDKVAFAVGHWPLPGVTPWGWGQSS